jgi:NitT/TauT family transport system ATP-binding protein
MKPDLGYASGKTSGPLATAAIDIDNVSLTFADPASGAQNLVLSEVSLSVRSDEFVALIGPSGCGKTTLLNLVAGFQAPDSGAASVYGRPVRGTCQEAAFMFAKDTLLPWRTARANVQLAQELGTGQPTAEASEWLKLVGLSKFADYYPAQMSQGMRQRVALARTLAAERTILLMDEPFGAVDAQTKTLLEDVFVRIWESQRKTVMFVTHDLSEALVMADRIVVMSTGPGRIIREHTVPFPRPRRSMSCSASCGVICEPRSSTLCPRRNHYDHDLPRPADGGRQKAAARRGRAASASASADQLVGGAG